MGKVENRKEEKQKVLQRKRNKMNKNSQNCYCLICVVKFIYCKVSVGLHFHDSKMCKTDKLINGGFNSRPKVFQFRINKTC